MTRRIVAAAITIAALGCGGAGSVSGPTPVSETLEVRFQTEHFRVVAGNTPDATLRAAADRLESQYARVLGELAVSAMPVVTVRIWQDQATYFNELTRYFGVRYQASGYITGPSELRLLADSALSTNVVHEFIHAVSMVVNPQFANNPRWLWESVALYENGELVNPRTIDYLVRGAFPTLQQLNADPNNGTQIYQLGYTFGEFIVARYGRQAFVRLIQTNGDLSGVLGLTAAEFEVAWQSYVRERYLS